MRSRATAGALRAPPRLSAAVRSHELALSLGFASPQDLLDKVERDMVALDQVIAAQDESRIGDVLYKFSVSVSSIKDWLKVHPSRSYADVDVERKQGGRESFLGRSGAIKTPDPFYRRKQELRILCGSV